MSPSKRQTSSRVAEDVFANNPTMCAIVEARRLYGSKDCLIISMGTGSEPTRVDASAAAAPAADAATIAPATRNVRRRSTCGILCREAISDVRVACDTAQWTSAQMTQPTGVRATSKEARDRLALKRTRGRRTATNADRLQTVAPQKPASDVPVLAAVAGPAVARASRASMRGDPGFAACR